MPEWWAAVCSVRMNCGNGGWSTPSVAPASSEAAGSPTTGVEGDPRAVSDAARTLLVGGTAAFQAIPRFKVPPNLGPFSRALSSLLRVPRVFVFQRTIA